MLETNKYLHGMDNFSLKSFLHVKQTQTNKQQVVTQSTTKKCASVCHLFLKRETVSHLL